MTCPRASVLIVCALAGFDGGLAIGLGGVFFAITMLLVG